MVQSSGGLDARNAVQHSAVHRKAPHSKELSNPKCNSAEVEKSCCKPKLPMLVFIDPRFLSDWILEKSYSVQLIQKVNLNKVPRAEYSPQVD